MDYSPDNTCFDFNLRKAILTIYIDRYYGDSLYRNEPDTDLDDVYPEEVRINAVKCGRTIVDKDGYSGGWMFIHEYIHAGEIAQLRAYFEALRDRHIEAFDRYPTMYLASEGEAFMSFSAKRLPKGALVHVSLRPDCDEEEFNVTLSERKLSALCDYFRRINEWFPPVKLGEKRVFRGFED